MDKKKASETGIRVQLPKGTDESWAVDEFVSDFVRGDADGALGALHEPHSDRPHSDRPRSDRPRGGAPRGSADGAPDGAGSPGNEVADNE